MTSEEYNTCVHEYADRLFRFMMKCTRQEADARDMVQQSFEKLWIKHSEVSFDKAKSYLFKIGYNNFIDAKRKTQRISNVAETPEVLSSSSYHSYETKDLLHTALDKLSEIQREVILLRDYEGYSYKEIADIANITESQVKVYIFRGRKKMQQVITMMEKVG